ncbi:MAG: carbon-nitrogen hydrolase family protein [Pseudomonadota bacterium]
MKTALLQLNVSDDPVRNLPATLDLVRQAAEAGAQFILTPEVTNCVSLSRSHQNAVLQLEEDDQTLAALRDAARRYNVWVLVGSIGLKTNDADGRFANRSFMIDPSGAVVARYDKIHMFDVQVTPEETFRESDGYRPGERAVVADTDFGAVGMTVCYDLRFPALHRALAQSGARILTVPAAFSPVTGAAHWHVLLRARAIETGCFILAPAQTGTHESATNKTRKTYGHSLVVGPWGEVQLDAGDAPGVYMTDLDMGQVDKARGKIPSLANARSFDGP